MKYTIKSKADTQELAKKIASQLKGLPRRSKTKAGGRVIGFIGNLGAGKTTFIQYLAKAIGIKEIVNSPTFNIIKVYSLSLRGAKRRGNPVINEIASPTARNDKKKKGVFVHIDAYRLNSPEELEALGVQEYFEDTNTITVIEWADKVKNILPKDAMIIDIKIKNENERIFKIK